MMFQRPVFMFSNSNEDDDSHSDFKRQSNLENTSNIEDIHKKIDEVTQLIT